MKLFQVDSYPVADTFYWMLNTSAGDKRIDNKVITRKRHVLLDVWMLNHVVGGRDTHFDYKTKHVKYVILNVWMLNTSAGDKHITNT